jgi:8-amino-3,8-dideoxy-alpha-D-manno-octulosonate transaminase
LYRLSDAQQKALLALDKADFSASDRIISRCISTAIGLLWTEEQTREKGEKIVAAVKKVVSREKAPVA